jgi:membrane-associated phospholipid phosphatase
MEQSPVDGMPFRVSEWVALTYFAYLACAALARPLPPRRRARIVAQSVAMIAVVVSAAGWPEGSLVRDWIPGVYLLFMYWIPASLIIAPHIRFEQLLEAGDRWCAGVWPAIARSVPLIVRESLELAYLLCYPLIPIGLGVLLLGGAAWAADRYWTAVLTAGALSYGPLPWPPTRPPRAVAGEDSGRAAPVRALNLRILRHGSVQWNTFPSGHVATAAAAALAVGAVFPVAGAALGLIAVGVAVAAAAGRYHYVADVVAGGLVAALAFALSRA